MLKINVPIHYAYYLDMVKFETVPEYIVKAIDDYMERTYSKA